MNKYLLSASALALASAVIPSGVALAAAAAPATEATNVQAVIVTGTRTTGLKAADSPAPVEVIGSEALKHVGQPDLISGLAQNVPAFTAEAFANDTAALSLSARLRGVSPNDTLVLINGKRRHPSANLHVLGGPYQGASTADIGLIPVGAIDHVEVLLDGAAAQYGTDAIAGVVNIILKKNNSGGSASVTGGQYYEGDGQTAAASLNAGFDLNGRGYLNVTAEQRYHDYSQRGGADRRIYNIDGTLRSTVPQNWTNLPGAPRVNKIIGDPTYRISTLMFNAGYELAPNAELYATGSYNHRSAQAFENYRRPHRVIASPVLGVTGSYTAPGELIFAPNGFSPKEGLEEDDYGLTVGVKGNLQGWDYDFSVTYGTDQNNISTLNSANASLFADTHFTPTNFHDGSFTTEQTTANFDISRGFEVGFAKPLVVAAGAESRRDTYEITPGDAGSVYKEGAQSYPGFQQTDAGKHTRENYAGYLDVNAYPIKAWNIDGAVRFEHFSDFGDTTVAKLTSRYDINEAVAVRGTISSGFRAPTLAEEYYSATNVSPAYAIVQLPSNSAAAKLIGFQNLKPEESDNYSFGLVLHPAPKLSVTLDVYDIKIKNRIVATGTIYGSSQDANGNFLVVSQPVLNAVAAHGNVLDPTVSYTGVSLFTNGVDTDTQGVEFTANYASDFGDLGHVDWSFSANYNKTSLDHIGATPTQIQPQALFDPSAKSYLTTSSPKYKLTFGALWTRGPWTVNAKETVYGESSDLTSPNGVNYYPEKIPVAAVTDLEVDYQMTEKVKVAVGANNLFDKNPPSRPQDAASHQVFDGSNVFDAPLGFSPYGINGGYYYGRVTYSF